MCLFTSQNVSILRCYLFDLIGDQKCAGSSQQPILCQFKGKALDISYKFNIADVSNECNIIVFSYYFFDGDGDSKFVPEDEGNYTEFMTNYILFKQTK